MVALTAGTVVLVKFPFSDLSGSKLRPALVIAFAERDDWVLCQITSNPYGDPKAVSILLNDFLSGSLIRESFVRPGKIFTANTTLITSQVGILKPEKFNLIRTAVVDLIKGSDEKQTG
jgi:mRNA interferase MazF